MQFLSPFRSGDWTLCLSDQNPEGHDNCPKQHLHNEVTHETLEFDSWREAAEYFQSKLGGGTVSFGDIKVV